MKVRRWAIVRKDEGDNKFKDKHFECMLFAMLYLKVSKFFGLKGEYIITYKRVNIQ
jgi:hypothetical protein